MAVARAQAGFRRSKYGAVRMWVHPNRARVVAARVVGAIWAREGLTEATAKAAGWIACASGVEARRLVALSAFEAKGAIMDLRYQVRYPLLALCAVDPRVAGWMASAGLSFVGRLVGHYVADFEYTVAATGEVVIEDTKGVRTDLFAWKMRHFRAQYGFGVVEVTAARWHLPAWRGPGVGVADGVGV